jgi:hypothetical protein
VSEAEQREVAETLFEQRREEIRDAIKLEEERRAALVKNLYRLRTLRLSRDRSRMRIKEAVSLSWGGGTRCGGVNSSR